MLCRKQTPEPMFGIIKSARGTRQFSLLGLDKVRGEWSLVTMAWILKRMFVLAPRLTRRPSVPAPAKQVPDKVVILVPPTKLTFSTTTRELAIRRL